MKRLVLALFATALLGALVPSVAFAKGASEATITGPGLDRPVTLAGEGATGGERLMQIAQEAGFFQAVYGASPNWMRASRPEGDLGPRFRISYVMPGPDGGQDALEQDLYPYATPSPVSYMRPGQSFYGTEKTLGGWYVAGSVLKDELVGAGLPKAAPAGGGADFPWTVAISVAVALVAFAAVALGALRIRHRPGPATA